MLVIEIQYNVSTFMDCHRNTLKRFYNRNVESSCLLATMTVNIVGEKSSSKRYSCRYVVSLGLQWVYQIITERTKKCRLFAVSWLRTPSPDSNGAQGPCSGSAIFSSAFFFFFRSLCRCEASHQTYCIFQLLPTIIPWASATNGCSAREIMKC